MSAEDSESVAIERRIEQFILLSGAAITIGAAAGWGRRPAEGAAIGTALCWLNFRWLRQGAEGVIRLGLAQAGVETVRVPRRTHAKFLGRIALLLLVVYAILTWVKLPVVAVFCGLTAVFPAILMELGYEVVRGQHRWSER
jgi:ATP synthase I chain